MLAIKLIFIKLFTHFCFFHGTTGRVKIPKWVKRYRVPTDCDIELDDIVSISFSLDMEPLADVKIKMSKILQTE